MIITVYIFFSLFEYFDKKSQIEYDRRNVNLNFFTLQNAIKFEWIQSHTSTIVFMCLLINSSSNT